MWTSFWNNPFDRHKNIYEFVFLATHPHMEMTEQVRLPVSEYNMRVAVWLQRPLEVTTWQQTYIYCSNKLLSQSTCMRTGWFVRVANSMLNVCLRTENWLKRKRGWAWPRTYSLRLVSHAPCSWQYAVTFLNTVLPQSCQASPAFVTERLQSLFARLQDGTCQRDVSEKWSKQLLEVRNWLFLCSFHK